MVVFEPWMRKFRWHQTVFSWFRIEKVVDEVSKLLKFHPTIPLEG